MPTLTFTWHTHTDERTCPVCAPLDGYQWIFYTKRDSFPKQLFHPQFGVVWDLIADEPRTHGIYSRRGPWNCRCRLSWEINDSDWQDALIAVRRRVRMSETRLVAMLRLIEEFEELLAGVAYEQP